VGSGPPVALARLVTMTRTVSQRYRALIHLQEDNKTPAVDENQPSREIRGGY